MVGEAACLRGEVGIPRGRCVAVAGSACVACSSCDGRDEILLELAGDRLQELAHRLGAEIAAVGHGPLVILLGEDRADEPQQRAPHREDPDDMCAPLDLLVEPLQRVGGVQAGAMRLREVQVREHVLRGLLEARDRLGEPARRPSTTRRSCATALA